MTMTRRGERFFFFYALALFAIVATAFPLHALVNGDELPPLLPHMHVHAVSMGLWFALMMGQTSLIGRGNYGLHKTLGVSSLALVPVMLGTGLYISWENLVRTGDNTILIANIANAAVFLVFYSAALLNRAKAALHKRFMLFAGLALMFPAFSRVTYILHVDVYLVLPMWLAFLLAVPVYDLITQRRITAASAFAVAINGIYIVSLILATSPPPG
ncbi:hypothetical protein [Maricaulis maris]|uniref:Uncharacterized protein n=1 Tax=Maricaulis maris TaxID=74318 RepID=A0A495DLZ9_9PROT|nr:hypothetical protein [Maricaulis maris]RKR02958.1 hypothetical protein C7435_0903 [Maricaulis maris]